MPSQRRRFTAEIRRQGRNLYLEIPPDVSAAFRRYGQRRMVRVSGTLRGAPIRGNLVPRGDGHWLFVHAGMKAAAGVGLGDTAEVVLRAHRWDEIPLAADVRAALRRAGALDRFEAMSPDQRHQLLRWVDIATSPERRAGRLERMAEQVLGATRPAKEGRAARRRRPLWICPNCGHRFVNTNQWHSCRRYSVDETFAGSEPRVRELFERLRALIESIGPVHVQAYRDKIAFLVRVRFAGAMPKKKWLDVGFWLPRRVEHERLFKVETLTPTDHVHLLRLTEPTHLDEQLESWLREAYAVGEQRHLG